MSLGRYWRTVRHLGVGQVGAALQRRARHTAWRHWPEAARKGLQATAAALPLPDPAHPALAAVAAHVSVLQAAMHGAAVENFREGRFRFLGREVDFGSTAGIDWRRDIGEETSPLWRLTLAYLGWCVPLLATGERRDRQRVAECVRRIMSDVPWSASGVFRDIWSPYTASHRLINLLAGLALHPPSAVDHDVWDILDHVRFCAALIATDLEYDLQYNHLLKNHVALAVYAAPLPEIPDSLRFLARAVPRSLQQVVLPDGGHAERSPMYQALGLLDLRMLRASGVFSQAWQPCLDRAIADTEQALGVLLHPDGEVSLFNDSWLGGAPGRVALGTPMPGAGRHELPVTGYVRLDGGDDCVIFDCGPVGPPQNPGHAHADLLSVEVSVARQRLLVDAGTPTYATGPLRDQSRSSASHNGPRVVGEEPIEFWKSFRVGRLANAGTLGGVTPEAAPLWAAGWHDGYHQRGIEVRRWVGLWPGRALAILDLWLGPPPVDGVSRFLVGPGWAVGQTSPLQLHGPRRVTITATIGTLSDPEAACYWPRYGEEESGLAVHLRPASGGVAAALFAWGELPLEWSEATARQLTSTLKAARRIDHRTAQR